MSRRSKKVEEVPEQETKKTKKTKGSAKPTKAAASPSQSPSKRQASRSTSPSKREPVEKEAVAVVTPSLEGLEHYIPLFKERKRFVNLGLDRAQFWNAPKPSSGFNKDDYEEDKVSEARKEYVREQRYKLYTEPYKNKKAAGKGNLLKYVQEFNFQLTNVLAESIADAAYCFGKYGKKSVMSYKAGVRDENNKKVEKVYTVTYEDYKYAATILGSRIEISMALEKYKSKADPKEPRTSKVVMAILTDNAEDWINKETFLTDFFVEGEQTDFTKWLAKKLGGKNGKFSDTFASRGVLTRDNYTRLIHLALEKEKDFSAAPLSEDIKGKKYSCFAYSNELTNLNNSVSTFALKGKNKVSNDEELTVAEVLKSGGKPYSDDHLLQHAVYRLTSITSYPKDSPPEDATKAAYLQGDFGDEQEAFDKETEAIKEFFKQRTPLLNAAGRERQKKFGKKAAKKDTKEGKKKTKK